MNKTSRQITTILFLVFVCIVNAYGQLSAVDWIDKVIENKNNDRIENNDYYQFDQYEKFTISVTKLDKSVRNPEIHDKLHFIYQYVDTSEFNGERELPVSLKETISREYRRRNAENEVSYISAIRHEGLDRSITTERINALLNEGLKQVDVFENEINLLFRRFISPLSSINVHRFYDFNLAVSDTTQTKELMEVSFSSKNEYDKCFYGSIWVSTDGKFSVERIVLHTPKNINLNFVTDLTIDQTFERSSSGFRVKRNETIDIEFSLFKIWYGIRAKDIRLYSDYDLHQESPVNFGFNNETIYLKDAEKQQDSIWYKGRPLTLSKGEENVKAIAKDIDNVPLYDIGLYLGGSILNNYFTIGDSSKFNIGPIFSTISKNEAQGWKFRLGGQTTSYFNKRLYLDGYVAYGTKDKRWAYSGKVDYYFKRNLYSGHEFPQNNISFLYQYDIQTPGQSFLYTDPDNFFLSLKRGKNDKLTYVRKGEVWYEKEYSNGFYWKLRGKVWNEHPAAALKFIKMDKSGNIENINSYDQTEIGIVLRMAFNEKFHQSHNSRLVLSRDGPIFTLSHTAGLKNVLGGQHNYQFTELAIQKRFWLYGYGHMNFIVKGGKLWGKVPYPLLILPNANKSYTIQDESYSLMNVLEFINDQYLSLDFSYYGDGWLFNRIPFIRSLKWREVVSFKGLMGSLSSGNNPLNNNELFLFPEGSYTMNNDPYLEVSIGIENIIRFLRIDYVRRLTYLHHPDIDKGGLRLTYNLMF